MSNCRAYVAEMAVRHGILDPAELLYALLQLVGDQHRMAVMAGGQGYSDGLDSLTGEHAQSFAESLRNWAGLHAMMQSHNAKVEQEAGRHDEAQKLDRYARSLQALVDTLDYYLLNWNFQGGEMEEAVKRHHERMRKQEKPPDAPPPA